MIGVLQAILCAIETLAAGIVDLLVLAINGAIVALGALVAVVMLLLPVMPEPPGAPSSSVLGFINWLFPLASAAALMTSLGALFVAFLAVRIILNWLRAL